MIYYIIIKLFVVQVVCVVVEDKRHTQSPRAQAHTHTQQMEGTTAWIRHTYVYIYKYYVYIVYTLRFVCFFFGFGIFSFVFFLLCFLTGLFKSFWFWHHFFCFYIR